MRRERFDWAIDLQGLARSGLFAWLANAGLTVGLDNLREGSREGAVALYDVTPPRAPRSTPRRGSLSGGPAPARRAGASGF